MGEDILTTLGAISDGFETGLSFLPSPFLVILTAAISFILLYAVIHAVVKIVGSFF